MSFTTKKFNKKKVKKRKAFKKGHFMTYHGLIESANFQKGKSLTKIACFTKITLAN